MGLPATLKNFLLFNDGNKYQGQVPEVSLPKIAMKAESHRAGGMLGEVDLDMGLEKLEMEWKAAGLIVGILRQLGMVAIDGVQLRFTGAYQDDSTGSVTSADLLVRGRHAEFDHGSAKVGDKTEMSIKTSLTYLQWTVNGRVEVEIDMLNNVYVVDGVDRMAEINLALGLSPAI